MLLELLLLLPDKKHGWEVQGKVLGACLHRMSWLCIGEGVRLGEVAVKPLSHCGQRRVQREGVPGAGEQR